jgi:hypothetical protein
MPFTGSLESSGRYTIHSPPEPSSIGRAVACSQESAAHVE